MIKNIVKGYVFSWPDLQVYIELPRKPNDMWPDMAKRYNEEYKKWDITVRN